MNKHYFLGLLTISSLSIYGMQPNNSGGTFPKASLTDTMDCKALNLIHYDIDNDNLQRAAPRIALLSNNKRKYEAEKFFTATTNDTMNQCYKNIDLHKYTKANEQKNYLPENKMTEKVQKFFFDSHSNSIEGRYETAEYELYSLQTNGNQELKKYEKLLTTVERICEERPQTKEELECLQKKVLPLKETLAKKVLLLMNNK